jgi:hypothetical protein
MFGLHRRTVEEGDPMYAEAIASIVLDGPDQEIDEKKMELDLDLRRFKKRGDCSNVNADEMVV